jgi:hypothetical protein
MVSVVGQYCTLQAPQRVLLFHLVREIKPGNLVVYPSKRDQQIPLGP